MTKATWYFEMSGT